jgi:protein-disulfide isomerase/uncharacterized membrane protein
VALVALNRILILLGYVGLFISGLLSMQHLLHISLPCGIQKGCDVVARHPSSYLFGNFNDGGLAVAYIGFAGYVLLTVLAIVRGLQGVGKNRTLISLGFYFSAIGTIYSIYLTNISINTIHYICGWCIASLVTMILTTLVSAIMMQLTPKELPGPSKLDPLMAGVLTILAGISIGYGTYQLRGQTLNRGVADTVIKKKIDLVTKDSHIMGNPDAPITIIEFADLLCPTCREGFPVLEDLVKRSNGNVRLVFHHFPLFMKDDHKMALPAATIAEIAGEEGKFWDFVTAIYSRESIDLQSAGALLAIAEAVGLDKEKVAKRLENSEDPAVKRVTADINLANEILITGTPTLLIQAKGGEVEAVSPSQLEGKLNSEPYKSLIMGGPTTGK